MLGKFFFPVTEDSSLRPSLGVSSATSQLGHPLTVACPGVRVVLGLRTVTPSQYALVKPVKMLSLPAMQKGPPQTPFLDLREV